MDFSTTGPEVPAASPPHDFDIDLMPLLLIADPAAPDPLLEADIANFLNQEPIHEEIGEMLDGMEPPFPMEIDGPDMAEPPGDMGAPDALPPLFDLDLPLPTRKRKFRDDEI
eukprot:TRINITY_DN29278_c0_g1_i3.p1 TRINITY_DN29278_c0_g1~~TRINITY_DN29278_c0_g1_i3.p1  ORF type:complete len:112 (-),score=0.92 TRINITY_DN29278_c0_g1_i3:82-417(-)